MAHFHFLLHSSYGLFARPKETVEIVVKEILPHAIHHTYTENEIKRIISSVSENAEGRLEFRQLQDVILKDQRRRLLTLMEGGNITKAIRKQLPFQTKPTKILGTMLRKKKLLPPQEFNVKTKRLHSGAGLIAPVEMQNLSSQLSANILLLRDVGKTNDRWDRYSALRHTGRESYVAARNTRTTDKFVEGAKAPTASSGILKTIRGPLTAKKVVD